MQPVAPVALIILDGWGYREALDGNAIAAAKTPVMQSLWHAYPHTLIATSGKAVGLPKDQMGNSEVGHLTLGAGRVVPQELVRVSDAAEEGTLGQEPTIQNLLSTLKASGGTLHLLGLCSDGGVHSHIEHIMALVDIAVAAAVPVAVHAITDGRDTDPHGGKRFIGQLAAHLAGKGTLASLSGRYYAMDRDRRWDRVELAYAAMTGQTEVDQRPVADIIAAAYDSEITDEFIKPVRLSETTIQASDGVLFCNFRPDRARQLTQAFVSPDFDGFTRDRIQPLHFATLTQYAADLPVEVVFRPQNLDRILGEVISDAGLKQLRIAETEKYAHVTYFFNGGREEPYPGEERVLINSPMVLTYDTAPAMSAVEVTEKAVEAISRREYGLVVLNYANPDMVGHTGNFEAAVTAVQTVDECLGRLLSAIVTVGGTALITADHGNAELMWDETGNPWTAHTTNMVPFILVEGESRKIPGHGTEVPLREGGSLADVAATILEILGIEQPTEMTGQSLVQPASYEVTASRSPAELRS